MRRDFLFKSLIWSFILMIGSCSTINEDELMTTQVETKSAEEPEKYLLTIMTNLNEELVIAPSFRCYFPHEHWIHKPTIAFEDTYKDTLHDEDYFWIMPLPVKGKKWIDLETNNPSVEYDTSIYNSAQCPFFEGTILHANTTIHLIYEDSIPYSGGGSTGDSGNHGENFEDENTDDYMHFTVYYNRMRNGPNGSKQLIFNKMNF